MARLSKYKLRVWSVGVRWRDRKCVICGTNTKLQAHHLNDKSNHPEQAYDLDNGVTLCSTKKTNNCHSLFHNTFKGNTRRKTTKEDFDRFIVLIRNAQNLNPIEIK